MFVKVHYSGLAISYAGAGGGKKSLTPTPPKKNNSRLNRQKRAIHDAVEWMRRNATYKPLIFCLTVPVESDYTLENKNVSNFCDNLKQTYGAKNYVWVREYQRASGRPHYHFVADSPFINAVDLSVYWSGMFGEAGRNTVRMGTNPKRPPVKYFVDSPAMARYLTKYMGKEIGPDETKKSSRKIRGFGHSLECWQKSRPVIYQADIFRNFSTVVNAYGEPVQMLDSIDRTFTLCENSEKELIEVYGVVPEHLKEFDDSVYSWINPNPLHRVYYGIPSRKKKSTKKKYVPALSSPVESQKNAVPVQSLIIF